jgi:hypothetical protein
MDRTIWTTFFRPVSATRPSHGAVFAKGKVVGVMAVGTAIFPGRPSPRGLWITCPCWPTRRTGHRNSRLYEYIEHANTALSNTPNRGNGCWKPKSWPPWANWRPAWPTKSGIPLVSIGGFTRRILKSLDEGSRLRFFIEVIFDEVTRLEKTLSEVLDFFRDTLGHLEEHDSTRVGGRVSYVLRRDLEDAASKWSGILRTTCPSC